MNSPLRNVIFLREIGIPVAWQRRAVMVEAETEALEQQGVVEQDETSPTPPEMEGAIAPPPQAQSPADSRLRAQPDARLPEPAPLAARTTPYGDQPNSDRQPDNLAGRHIDSGNDIPAELDELFALPPDWDDMPVPDEEDAGPRIDEMNWQQLEAAVAGCRACGLCHHRKKTVFGGGERQVDWVLIGDTPSHSDDQVGQPFTGQTGVLLDNMLRAVGKNRKQKVYLTNLVKCVAQDESGKARAPTAQEIAACRPYLQRQLQLLQPKLVLGLGKVAAQSLRDSGQGPLRGTVHQAFGLPMVATWHPAILLTQSSEKRQAWADWCLARHASTT